MFDIVKSALHCPIESKTLARWERKALESSSTNNNTTKTPVSASSGCKTPSRFQASGEASAVRSTARTPSQAFNDRFISSMGSSEVFGVDVKNNRDENAAPQAGSSDDAFRGMLAESLFGGEALNSKILTYKQKAPKPSECYQNELRVLYSQNKAPTKVKKVRQVNTSAERVLEAPGVVDDFYINTLDWGTNDMLAVALGTEVYLWNASTGDIQPFIQDGEDMVTSVHWMADRLHLAVGFANSEVQIWNSERGVAVKTFQNHVERVGALTSNGALVASGGRDGLIVQQDVRMPAAQAVVSRLRGHTGEVSGLKWSPDGSKLASGANDNLCCVWDAKGVDQSALFSFNESLAAVKALAWCPWQHNLLATGAGTADRNIRMYDAGCGTLINSQDTGSQVSALLWSRDQKELLSSHGYSQNQLTLWSYPSMARTAELLGHTSRVLNMCMSPDGSTVVSSSADEHLRFWKVWDAPKARPTKSVGESSTLSRVIR